MKNTSQGWLNGLIGIIIFSGTLPATRVAVMDFSPTFLTAARAAIAGMLGLVLILLSRQKLPEKKDWLALFYVAIGVVIGFPLFTSLALQYMSAAHSIVFIGLLPLATAIFGVLRSGEKPSLVFWLFAILGSSLVFRYMLIQAGNWSFNYGDIFMLIAILLCGFGYAEGGKLSRHLGGWQVICWALIMTLPLMLLISCLYMPVNFDQISFSSKLGLAYVSLFSMLIGFFFWYKGLAQGGIATVGQLQLLQPILGLMIAAILLHEQVSPAMFAVTITVIACVACAKKFA
ncbi:MULTISPECIES: DMT family transporter [unclassified Acinetobacter]|uniref:DMT family transporter n=1 Tax=unclassified Acinetobacter TaxID=196816 RepID=UPI002446F5A6|nr:MULTISPECIES: DMT family transporter [unclassified Acinetobacter]MDH0030196.1 DMT family transporter [Acinetobacter sp. GD04021]MDH0885764.1 DMT family transporter [Acinetobacter sp. GD03873]MDH1082384.1 DMT family transporter [Acinetobacter sp. GD03983]MDH2189224.1 DMT family transporter [Acinetobacter sp. GD03645]MDH2202412.1 DMT family transporter [Acinetobacter sp. GD03647]